MRRPRAILAILLALVMVASIFVGVRAARQISRMRVIAYFDNSTGLFRGDDVRILGVPVGEVDKIEPEPERVKITFWVDSKYKVPADAKAAILSPQLVTGRAIQLTPVYTGGPAMQDGAVIPGAGSGPGPNRTAVPVEWDDIRAQLAKLTELLKPTKPGGVSTLGDLINTAADNLRGQGANIRDTVIKLSQAISALADHSKDIFGTFKNLSTLVTALHDSSDLLEQLNRNLAAVTSLLADDPNKVGQAVEDLNSVVGDVQSFFADNREAIGTASDKLASITTALVQSLDDIKQTLHIAPTTFANFLNIFEPANGALTGVLSVNNFANTISFICGAVQAASHLSAAQASKLCVQYLAPIVKNRQYNFPPLGFNLFNGPMARPNEVSYSEDWMRPDYVPAGPPGSPAPPQAPLPAEAPAPVNPGVPLAAEAPPPANPSVPMAAEAPAPANPSPPMAGQGPAPGPTVSTNPAAGLSGMMVSPGGGS